MVRSRSPGLASEAVVPSWSCGCLGGSGGGSEAETVVAAGERVGRVDERVAGVAEEGVVRSAVPPRTAADTAVAGAGRFAANGGGRPCFVGVAVVVAHF